MIIPTAEYDPLFADDGVPFRDKMVNYIRREFPDVLGARITQLQSDEGLEQLSNSIRDYSTRQPCQSAAA